ncbi:hypothetical protein [Microbulbifer aestuariivivens]
MVAEKCKAMLSAVSALSVAVLLAGTTLGLAGALAGCAAGPAQRVQASAASSEDLSANLTVAGAAGSVVGSGGLQSRSSSLDNVSAVFALDLSGASVYVAPLEIRYRPRPPGALQNSVIGLDARKRELDSADRARLQEVMEQAFAGQFLGPRGARLTSQRRGANYTLRLRLDDFYLPAPLQPTSGLQQVFSEGVASGTLAGTLYDREGNPVLQFSERRQFGDHLAGFAGPGGASLQRFSPPAFWAGMRMDLRHIFAGLNRSLP